ncbi:serine/threonine protein kinase, partial [Bacteroidota bacterium]
MVNENNSSQVGKIVSHYKISEKLGSGGMGIVYKAEDINLKRTVALKFLSPQSLGGEEDKKRFIHEAQSAAALDHPNICIVYEIEEAEGQIFISMAYIDGQSLEDKINTGPMKLGDAVETAIEVAYGLNEAHEKGIVHRDIKSANIMLTSKDQAKIMDFGLARKHGRTRITQEGTSVGTVAYMSPEQSQGGSVDQRTDIWSFGVMLYEMISGQLPFKGDYEQAVVYSIINEEPEPLTAIRTGVPMELERIVSKATAKDPNERYQNVNDMLIDLKSVQREIETGISRTRMTAAASTKTGIEKVSFFKDLIQRRIPQILGIYFAAGWGILQFVDWLVNRYILSPNLTDLSLVALLSMIPTVLFLAYFHGKPGKDKWTKVEKFGIPINLIASVILLLFLFYGKDLGAAQTTVTVEDDEGNQIERVVPKSEFRKKVALFFFDNETNDSTLNWLGNAVPYLLFYDLAQDLFLNITDGYRIQNKLKEAGFPTGTGVPLSLKSKIADELYMKYFISGSISKQDEEYSVIQSLYETERVKLIKERTFKNNDLFRLADELSLQIKYDLEIPDQHIEEVKDLPVSEITTNSMPALKQLIEGLNELIFYRDW